MWLDSIFRVRSDRRKTTQDSQMNPDSVNMRLASHNQRLVDQDFFRFATTMEKRS